MTTTHINNRPPNGDTSGGRAFRTLQAAGFHVTWCGIVAKHPGELRTVMEHPDGRRVELLTSEPAASLIRARPMNRSMWPAGVAVADSVPRVEDLAKAAS